MVMPSEWCRQHGVAHLGISRGKEIVDVISTQEPTAEFRATVDVIDKPSGRDFRGPYVFGKLGERFLYLNWGTQTARGWISGQGGRTKLQLGFVSPTDLDQAVLGRTLVAELILATDAGRPAFATVKAPVLQWGLGPR
jgi:hypothetical protein